MDYIILEVYLKKSAPDEWENLIEDYNRKYLNPPLSNAEVENVKKSLRKKDYNYGCNEQPINSFVIEKYVEQENMVLVMVIQRYLK